MPFYGQYPAVVKFLGIHSPPFHLGIEWQALGKKNRPAFLLGGKGTRGKIVEHLHGQSVPFSFHFFFGLQLYDFVTIKIMCVMEIKQGM